eukprot:8594007-Pyramimonas_sp.AAC.1
MDSTNNHLEREEAMEGSQVTGSAAAQEMDTDLSQDTRVTQDVAGLSVAHPPDDNPGHALPR